MKQSSGDARSSRRDAMGGQFHAPLPTFLRMNQSTRRIFQQSTTQTRLTTTSGISQLSRMPVSWTIITNFIREDSLSRNTLLDSALRMLANKNREINVLGLKTWPYETACQNYCMAWIKIMYICKIKISPNK